MNSVAAERTNISPQNIPWDLIRVLITETYGGKIDNAEDFELLRGLVTSVMTPNAYEINHKLVESSSDSEGSLVVPTGTGMAEFMGWIDALPEREPPTYLGLPANAEKLLLTGQARRMMGDLRRISEVLDEGEMAMAEAI